MAFIRARKRASGDVLYRVSWRQETPEGRREQGEDFDDEELAKRFCDLVNGHGQQWPPGWVKGVGFVEEDEDDESEERSVPPEELFPAYAEKYVGLLTGIQDGTRSNYRKFLKNHLNPWFQDLSVRQGEGGIGQDEIRAWVNDLEAGRPGPHHPPHTKRKPLAPKTIRNLHGFLYGIMQSTVTADPALRSLNPCLHTRLPENNHTGDEQIFLEREEYALIRSHLHADSVDLVEALVNTGLRWSEITALRVSDLTLKASRRTLRVQRSWKRVDGGKVLGAPKTKKSRRTIVLSPSLVRLFLRAVAGKKPSDFVFTAPGGGVWDSGQFYHARWSPALDGAAEEGLTKRPRIHDLRHTHASWLIARNVPLPGIQARLGHESIVTTVDLYGHLLETVDDEINDAVEWAMNFTLTA